MARVANFSTHYYIYNPLNGLARLYGHPVGDGLQQGEKTKFLMTTRVIIVLFHQSILVSTLSLAVVLSALLVASRVGETKKHLACIS